MPKRPDVRLANLAKEVFKHIPLAKELWFIINSSRGYIEVSSTHELTNGQGEVVLNTTIGLEDFGNERHYSIGFSYDNMDVYDQVMNSTNNVADLLPMYNKTMKELKEATKKQPINGSVNRSSFIKDFGEALTELYMHNVNGGFIVNRVPNKTNVFQVSKPLSQGGGRFNRLTYQVTIIQNKMTAIPLTQQGNTSVKFEYHSVKELIRDLEQARS